MPTAKQSLGLPPRGPDSWDWLVDDDGDWLTSLVTGHASRGIIAVDFAGMVVWAAEQMKTLKAETRLLFYSIVVI